MVKNKNGYTLIELIVVIGVAALVFGMTISSFDSFNANKKIDSESELLRSRIEEILKKTDSGDLEGDMQCGLDTSGKTIINQCNSSHYTLTLSQNRFSLDFFCICPGTGVENQKNIFITKAIPDNAKISFSSAQSVFIFQRKKITNGCVNVIYKDSVYNSVSFSYPGDVSLGIGSSCP